MCKPSFDTMPTTQHTVRRTEYVGLDTFARCIQASCERGITLIELMVAMTISLVIMAVMTQIFVSSRGTYNVEEGLARVQESGRFAMDTLAYDIRMSGASGCVNLPDGSVNENVPGAATSYDQSGIQGFRYVGSGGNNMASDWSPPLPAAYFNAGDVKARSDVIIVKYATAAGINLVNATAGSGDNTQTTIQISDADAASINPGDAMMTADCVAADIFSVTALNSTSGVTSITFTSANGNDNSTLKGNYSASRGGELLRFFAHAYYAGNTARTDQSGNAIPALFRKTLGVLAGAPTPVAEELVEGAEAVKIFYGVLPAGVPKVSNAPDRYVPASTTLAADWSGVASIRVGLVMSTIENVLGAESSSTTTGVMDVAGLPGSTGENAIDDYDPPNDGRQRRVFSFVVQKRKPLR